MKTDFRTTGRCLDITTAKICSVNCQYWCPQLKFRMAYDKRISYEESLKEEQDKNAKNFLSFDDFSIALSKTPKDVNIVFAGFAEPFMNYRTIDMIEEAHNLGYKVALYSTLAGLMAKDVPRLTVLDYFCLHEPDNLGIANIPDTPNYRETLSKVLRQPGLTINERSRMSQGFYGQDRAGQAEATTKPRKVKGWFYCRKLMQSQPILLPNLDVQLCSQDWLLKEKMGSMRTDTYEEIVGGELFRGIVDSQLNFTGSELCRSCSNAWSLPKAALIEIAFPIYRKAYEYSRRSSGI